MSGDPSCGGESIESLRQRLEYLQTHFTPENEDEMMMLAIKLSEMDTYTESGNGFDVTTPDRTLPGECGICYEPFTPGRPIITLKCFCRFHQECMEKWWTKREDLRGKCILH